MIHSSDRAARIVRVISKRRLREFWGKNPESKLGLSTWFKVTRKKDRSSLQDVRATYPNADGLTPHCGITATVFNVCGNKYRLITRISYSFERYMSRWF